MEQSPPVTNAGSPTTHTNGSPGPAFDWSPGTNGSPRLIAPVRSCEPTTAADSGALVRLGQRHFDDFELAGRCPRHQRATTDGFIIGTSQKDLPARFQNRLPGIPQRILILRLEHKVPADPRFIQPVESVFIIVITFNTVGETAGQVRPVKRRPQRPKRSSPVRVQFRYYHV